MTHLADALAEKRVEGLVPSTPLLLLEGWGRAVAPLLL